MITSDDPRSVRVLRDPFHELKDRLAGSEPVASAAVRLRNRSQPPANAGREPVQLRGLELDAFLAQPDPEYDWLVPGLLERGDRVIWTGGEGKGKSMLLRMQAVQLASGIHPFTLERIPPLRVAYVDLENSDRQTRRQLRPLRLAAGSTYDDGRLHVVVEPGGLDLAGQPNDRAWLEAELDAMGALDLLTIGPLYKMADGDPTREEFVRPLQRYLDQLRERYQVALVMEAHSPHAPAGGKRTMRPYGGSAWLRWPEFGLHLGDDGAIGHWRDPRDERDWPALLRRGGAWPWTPSTDRRELLWARVLEYVDCAPTFPSQRELATALATPKGTVQRCLEAHPAEWEQLRRKHGDDDA